MTLQKLNTWGFGVWRNGCKRWAKVLKFLWSPSPVIVTSSITRNTHALTMHLFNGKNGRSQYCMDGRKPWVDMDCRPITYRRCQQFMLIVAAHNVTLKHISSPWWKELSISILFMDPAKMFQNMETMYCAHIFNRQLDRKIHQFLDFNLNFLYYM